MPDLNVKELYICWNSIVELYCLVDLYIRWLLPFITFLLYCIIIIYVVPNFQDAVKLNPDLIMCKLSILEFDVICTQKHDTWFLCQMILFSINIPQGCCHKHNELF